MKYDDKPNNELLQLVNNTQVAHAATKVKILKLLDELDLYELEFKKINNILKNRLGGNEKTI